MPAVAIKGGLSTGHGPWFPVPDQGPYTTKSFFNGVPIQLRGVTTYAVHTKPGKNPDPHPPTGGTMHIINDSPGTFYMEGKVVAMIGDDMDCGDAVGKGSPSAFIG